MPITPERLRLALDQMDYDDGFTFERFANEFLASELPGLRPVAGIHDGARDAFVHSSESAPHVFCQHSVAQDWKTKITNTKKALIDNGFDVREIIYCTNRNIQREADDLRSKLRRENISLDIRDRSWFEAVANGSPARIAAAERIASMYVDPLLASKKAVANLSPVLTEEQERITATYLQLELMAKNPAKGLSKSCIEALVTVALRESTPEALVPRNIILDAVQHQLPGSDTQRAHTLVNSAIDRLVKRCVVKHHRKEDSFTLAFAYRTEMADRLVSLLNKKAELLVESSYKAQEIATNNGIDFDYDPMAVAEDALYILEEYICKHGRLAAVALVGNGNFFAPRESISKAASEILKVKPSVLKSLKNISKEHFLDLVPQVALDLVRYPTQKLLQRLNVLSDAYCLHFTLQQTPDVQEALKVIIYGKNLLVDTSIIIQCMSERLLPELQRRFTNLLRGVTAIGCKLVVAEDVINEIDTHLDRIKHAFANRTGRLVDRIGLTGAGYLESAIIRSFLEAKQSNAFTDTFDNYISLFRGNVSPLEDIIEYLKEDLTIEYDPMIDTINQIEHTDLAELCSEWAKHKVKRPWVDEIAFETLVRHDARAFLLVKKLRTISAAKSSYGNTWWWLVLDGTAFKFDSLQSRYLGERVCMSPEFFARYVSMSPKPAGITPSSGELLPVCLEVSELGFIPYELREDAIKAYEENKDKPEYLRKRRLRDFFVQAITTAHVSSDDDQK